MTESRLSLWQVLVTVSPCLTIWMSAKKHTNCYSISKNVTIISYCEWNMIKKLLLGVWWFPSLLSIVICSYMVIRWYFYQQHICCIFSCFKFLNSPKENGKNWTVSPFVGNSFLLKSGFWCRPIYSYKKLDRVLLFVEFPLQSPSTQLAVEETQGQ